MQAWIEDPNKVPKWPTLRKTVLISKTEDLSSEKNFRHYLQYFHWNISTTYVHNTTHKKTRRPKLFMG